MLTAHEKTELNRSRRRLKELPSWPEFYHPAPEHLRRLLETRIKELEAKEKVYGHTDTG